MYSSNFDDGQPVRRSLRVAHMTPSKINLQNNAYHDDVSEADSEATVKPLRLLGQQQQRSRSRSRSPAKSRGRTPSKKTAPNSSKKASNEPFYPNIPRGQLPLRLDTPQPMNEPQYSLLDSRVKQARNLDNHDPFAAHGTPMQSYSDWPSEPLITPLANVQQRRVSPLQFDEEGTAKAPFKIQANPSRLAKSNGIFSAANRQQKKSPLFTHLSWHQVFSMAVLTTGFLLSLFYRGEIFEFLSDKIDRLNDIRLFSPRASNPISQDWRRDLDNVFGDLQILKRDLSRIPQIDVSGIIDRLDQVESREASNDSLMQNMRQRLAEAQKSITQLLEGGQLTGLKVEEITQKLSTLHSRLGSVETNHDVAMLKLKDHDATLSHWEPILRDVKSSDEIVELALSKVKAWLPEKLLVRLSSSGEVILDPKLFGYLQTHFGESSNASNDGESKTHGSSADLKTIENFMQGKLDNLEHRILNKNQIIDLLKEHLEKSVAILKKDLHKDLQNINTSSTQPQIDIEKLSADLFKTVSERISQTKPIASVSRVNFASEAAGAHPIIALSSKSYYNNAESDSIWKCILSSAKKAKPHRLALQSDNSFGNCWAFSGSNGRLTLQLAIPIVPSAFSVCHLGNDLRVDRSSAPGIFEVYAIPCISVPDEVVLLGTYSYDLEGEACQTFAVQSVLKKPARHYQIRILSNQGHAQFTCLYQFGLYSDTHTV